MEMTQSQRLPVQFFKIDSATKVGEYYPATHFKYDVSGQAWSSVEKAWFFDPNDSSLTTDTFYAGVLQGARSKIDVDVYASSIPAFTATGNTLTIYTAP